jgi:2'-5' RNA ligase
MVDGKTFSLWLVPSGETYQSLASLISDLSEEYHSPCFPPHVTLLGSLHDSYENLKLKSSRLGARLTTYRINLMSVEYTNEYFRSLFIKVEETEDVLRANLTAREIFDRSTDPKYSPHLSILYGILSSTTKQSIIEKLGRDFAFSFEVESLHLVDTTLGPESWFVVNEYPFGST